MSVFFISDLHLGHTAILKFRKGGFKSVEEHDEFLIDQWNKKVTKRDTVWVLGDVVWGSQHLEKLGRFIGTKNLVLGNHDTQPIRNYIKYFNRIGGAVAYKHSVLTHIPIHGSKVGPLTRWNFNIHGHTHEHNVPSPHYINVSVDQLDGFAPINLEELREKYIGI